MKVETIGGLIDWTRALHAGLSECLRHCSEATADQRLRWLLAYLADHERALADVVGGFERDADRRALDTWIYDYLGGHRPLDPHRVCDTPYAAMSFEEAEAAVFDFHRQVLDLYRYLEGRAEIPEARELVDQLLAMEEHETARLARQAARIGDL